MYTTLIFHHGVYTIADITPAIRSIFMTVELLIYVRRGPLLTKKGYPRLTYEWIIVIVVFCWMQVPTDALTSLTVLLKLSRRWIQDM